MPSETRANTPLLQVIPALVLNSSGGASTRHF